MEKATLSKMQVLTLSKKFNNLSVKMTKMEVDHNLEFVAITDRAIIAQGKAKKEVVAFKTKTNKDANQAVALKEVNSQLQSRVETDAAKLSALTEVANCKFQEIEQEEQLEAALKVFELQPQQSKEVVKLQYEKKYKAKVVERKCMRQLKL